MRILMGGSRSIADPTALAAAIEVWGAPITSVITGTSTGADELASQWAIEHRLPLTIVPTDWAKYGGRAERVRIEQVTMMAQACIMVWDGFSRGTAQVIELAKARALDVVVYECNPQRGASGGTSRIHRAATAADRTPSSGSTLG